LQRARATLSQAAVSPLDCSPVVGDELRELLERYVAAFEAYDEDALTTVIREDAIQSMPPYDLWLSGREDIFRWWWGPGIGCEGSRVLPAPPANGTVALAQYKPSPVGGFDPWALQVVELTAKGIKEITFFLDTERLFPLFGMPPRLEATDEFPSHRRS
jgi:RNA polymerase sigma-70 factor (ECF subfamily)